jgi:2-amino-4-hydroxy-6-hydroxymethyldihydropteridine diphosphokinase
MVLAFVALGANLGDAPTTVRWAMNQLAQLPDTTWLAGSSLYRSAPVDAAGPDYINAVVSVSTALTAPDLLRELQQLERLAGRQRPYRHAPRTLDLDLLLYGDSRMDSPDLTLPHPRMYERAFVLVPLSEIAPTRVYPEQLQVLASQRLVCLGK